MDSAKLNDWLQIIGLFGVMASLLFVGIQLRQDHQIALANTYQARAATSIEAFHMRAANPAALSAELRALGKDPNAPVTRSFAGDVETMGTMTELEFRAGSFVAVATWQQWDNFYYQYELGFLPEESWSRLRTVIKRNFERETIAAIAYESHNTRPAFKKVVDEIVAEVEAEKSD